jgi:hypothetical protein
LIKKERRKEAYVDTVTVVDNLNGKVRKKLASLSDE